MENSHRRIPQRAHDRYFDWRESVSDWRDSGFASGAADFFGIAAFPVSFFFFSS
jgi:hypothetical protein